MIRKMGDIFHQLRNKLKVRTPSRVQYRNGSLRHASVLIPFFRNSDDYYLLFTKRTDSVEHHKGQISFPGGAVDMNDDSYLSTALREAEEEIGLREKDVEVLGQIDVTIALVSGFVIHPFVGIIPYPYEFKINSHEVERLIEVPLRQIVAQEKEKRSTYFEFGGKVYQTPAYEYKGEVIWGATARIVQNLLEIIDKDLDLIE